MFHNKFFEGFCKGEKSKQYFLESKLKLLESNLNCDINSAEYINCKNQREKIYDDIAKGIKVRSKCQWYEQGEKSTKFILNLEKTKTTQGTVKKLEIDKKEIDNSVEVNKKLEKFFESLFKRKQVYNEFLRDISLSTLSQEEKKFLTKELVNKK